MATQEAGAGKLPTAGMDLGQVLLSNVLQTILPSVLGTSNKTKKRASPEANAQATQAFGTLTKPQDYSGQTADILTQAAQQFAPAMAGERAAGLYDSTALEQMRNEAMARASAAAQGAILSDQTQRAGAAAQLAGASMQANNDTMATPQLDIGQALLSGGTMLAAPYLASKGADLLGGLFGGAAGTIGAPTAAMAAPAAGAFSNALNGISSGTALGIGPSTNLGGFMDLNLVDDLTGPLDGAMSGAVSGGFGEVGSNLFGGASDALGSFGGGGTFDVGSKLLSGDFGGAITSGIGYAFGGPVGGFIGNLIGKAFGCFLTTATCEYMGLPDDNEYLETLRKFRDSYMAESYPELIEEYYRISPAIVNYIAERPDKQEVYKFMFHAYILPACERIKAGDNRCAMETYYALVKYAKSVGGMEG
jgi:hypothetical protein